MEDLSLPCRMIAAGHEPLGERINVYHKAANLVKILGSLDSEEIATIRESSLGKLVEIPNLPAWSASFGLFLLGRQLDVSKPYEIWVLFAGNPIRFSLREFKIVTGFPCGKYPPKQKTKKKGTAGKVPFYSTLFGLEDDVTVDRVIAILKKRSVTDTQLRLRYAYLALVDGFLLPISHYPKISKEHVGMAENLDYFLSYPWGRLTFEMMMSSIKERDVAQLATTSVAVQGFLHALQMVVLQAVPAIQDGPISSLHDDSESEDEDEENAADLFPRDSVPLKLGNAKYLDAKCKVSVQSIICPEVEFDSVAEDLSWSDDTEDAGVENIIGLVKKGFKFKNEMFKGGCIPSELTVPAKKQKRGGKSKVSRGRATSKQVKNAANIRRTRTTPVMNDENQHNSIDSHALSRMLDDKLASLEDRIVKRVTAWFADNSEGRRQNERGMQNNAEKSDADFANEGFRRRQNESGIQQPDGTSSGVPRNNFPPVTTSVDDVAAYYNSNNFQLPDSPSESFGNGGGGSGDMGTFDGVDPAAGGFAPFEDPDAVIIGNEAGVNFMSTAWDNTVRDESAGLASGSENPKVFEANKSADGLNMVTGHEDLAAEFQSSKGLNTGEGKEDTVVGNEDIVPPTKCSDELSMAAGHDGMAAAPQKQGGGHTVVDAGHDGMAAAPQEKGGGDSVLATGHDGMAATPQGKDGADAADMAENIAENMSVPTSHVSPSENLGHDAPKDTSSLSELKGPVAAAVKKIDEQTESTGDCQKEHGGRRSKRLRTISSKLDGRFQFDKKTKLLVGHPSPLTPDIVDPSAREAMFQKSMEKLKRTSSISFGGGKSLTNKEIFDILERKKYIGNKVMDALIKFSRHLLRADEIDGEKLRVDVLDSKFVSIVVRLYPKFSKQAQRVEFKFPQSLIDTVLGSGDPERVQLFTDVDYIYLPFNFDKKHWVGSCVDLNCAQIVVLDSNLQFRTDAQIMSDLLPLAEMLPFLFKQAGGNDIMEQLQPSPLTIVRPAGIPQISTPIDSGLATIFLIHAHATGGVEECLDFDVGSVDSETKKLVSAIMQALAA